MPVPKPTEKENKSQFIERCMSDKVMVSEYDNEQRLAICTMNFANTKISFDYDGVLSTAKGFDLAKQLIDKGNDVYIISARHLQSGTLSKAKALGINPNRVYATGSNSNKIKKIIALGINMHYDNNPNVIKLLGSKGKLF